MPQDGPVLLGRDALDLLPDSVGVRGASLLRFDLVVRRSIDGGSADVLERWPDLCFNPTPSPGRHPFWLEVLQPRAVPPGENGRLLPQPPPDVTRSMNLRAAEDPTAAVYVPYSMDALGGFSEYGDAPEQSLPGTASVPGDDDLSEFHPISLFLDEQLAAATIYDLIPRVDQLTSLAATPEQLRGIHALATIEEVALIAVPDAVQRGWEPAAPPPTPQPASLPPSLPAPDWSAFRDCIVRSLPAPPGHKEPDPTAAPRPELISVSSYSEDDLFSIQQALVILCAARADAVAVLSLPEHYTPAQAVAWRRRVASSGELSGGPSSFAAVWYPWLGVVEESTPRLAPLRWVPPDGAACGTISARELARGVWLAPANLALRGPVSLSPAISPADTARLFDTAANVLVHQPGKFVALSAHTLSTDPRLLQVSVRRLLILLRKVALRRGARYVFEPNTERFRRLVRTSFERLLTALAEAGAITAFEVVTGGGVNTPNDIANGRFVIVLRVAPTSPVEFITVTLVRDREGLLDVVEA